LTVVLCTSGGGAARLHDDAAEAACSVV